MVVEGEDQVPDHAQAEFGNTMATVGEDPTEVRSPGKAGESPAKRQFAGNGRCKPD